MNIITKYSQEELEDIISQYEDDIKIKTYHHLGYPYNLSFDYGPIEKLLKYSINNLGDPFIDSNYAVHSRKFEVAVLDWFAKLWMIELYWGYMGCCGTEGNLYGILLGRENIKAWTNKIPILYTSKDTHYSILKASRMYCLECVLVNSDKNGEIDYHDLHDKLSKNKDKPALINANIGTTVKGGIDNIDKIIDILHELDFKDNHDFFIHLDGALQAVMLPFIDNSTAPLITFKKPIGSISISCHKFIGCPIVSCVVITRKEYADKLSEHIDYINSKDSTIMGSRNGFAPICMWYSLCRKSLEDIKHDVITCINNAKYLRDQLVKISKKPLLNENSNIVVFDKPKDENFIKKWQLAVQNDQCHCCIMPNVDKAKLDVFLKELVNIH